MFFSTTLVIGGPVGPCANVEDMAISVLASVIGHQRAEEELIPPTRCPGLTRALFAGEPAGKPSPPEKVEPGVRAAVVRLRPGRPRFRPTLDRDPGRNQSTGPRIHRRGPADGGPRFPPGLSPGAPPLSQSCAVAAGPPPTTGAPRPAFFPQHSEYPRWEKSRDGARRPNSWELFSGPGEFFPPGRGGGHSRKFGTISTEYDPPMPRKKTNHRGREEGLGAPGRFPPPPPRVPNSCVPGKIHHHPRKGPSHRAKKHQAGRIAHRALSEAPPPARVAEFPDKKGGKVNAPTSRNPASSKARGRFRPKPRPRPSPLNSLFEEGSPPAPPRSLPTLARPQSRRQCLHFPPRRSPPSALSPAPK